MTSTSTSTSTEMALLKKVAAMESKIDELLTLYKASMESKGEKVTDAKERKPRAPSSWNLFVKRVTEVLRANELPTTGILYFCSHLKASCEEYGEMQDEDILAEHSSWTPPEAKPKAAKPKEDKPKGDKPKRTISEEHKAALAAGRKAAAARLKAEKAAKAAAKEAGEPEAEEAEEAPEPEPEAKVEVVEPLVPTPFKGKRYLMDKATRGMWLKNADGSKGKWAGVLNKEGTSLDASAKEQ